LKNIFNFNEFYKKQSENTLKSLSLSNVIDIDSAIISDASTKARISRKITELSESGMLENRDVDKLIKDKYFEKHKKELPMIMTYEIINNKIKINNIKSLDAFLDTCAENYLKGLASEKQVQNRT
jgi:Domain of unknown function (DUF4868)